MGDVEAAQGKGKQNPSASEMNLPLITREGSRGEVDQPTEYFGAGLEGSSSNEGTPLGGAAPRLHPGLGALGQDEGGMYDRL